MLQHRSRSPIASICLILASVICVTSCSSSKESSSKRPRSRVSTTKPKTDEHRAPSRSDEHPPSTGRQRIYDYVAHYQEIARSEMLRTGIPASIKLGQAILESDAGRSELAQNARNHFGIKCSTEWNGPSYYKKDDDRRHGKLVKSCFRKYEDPRQSYIDHSKFLADPKKKKRYGHLFRLKSDDYKAWAKGLQKSGYATNRSYADRLISVIEKYQLYHYDTETEILEAHAPEVPQILGSEYSLYTIQSGDSLYAIARKHNMSVDELKNINRLNSNTIHPGDQLKVKKK